MGLFHKPRCRPSRIGAIGVLKTAAIGDTVLLSAVIHDLRKAFPRSRIVFFAGDSNFEIAQMLEGLDNVVRLPLSDPVTALKVVRSVELDIMIDFGSWPRIDAVLSTLSRANFTVGFNSLRQFRHYSYDLSIAHRADVHELENYRALVRAIGVETIYAPAIRPPDDSARPPVEGRYIVFHLWAGGYRSHLKEWCVDRWVLLARQVAGAGYAVCFTGAPGEASRNADVIALTGLHARVACNYAGHSLRDTAALLKRAALVVSVNTGVMHLAAALGTDLVALHGPTSPIRWGPISASAVVVKSPHPISGYLNFGWEYPKHPPPCMKAITYEAVWAACTAALARTPANDAVGVRDSINLP